MKTNDQINSIMERFDALKTSVHLDEKQMEMEELQIRMQDPEFWNDIEKAQSTNKKSKNLEDFINNFKEIEDNCLELKMMMEEDDESLSSDIDSMYDSLDERLSDLELCNMFNEDGDDMACSLTITAGAGGTEAQDWAKMLFRMYDMYCKAHGFSFTVTTFTEGVPVGLKSATVAIEGEHAYGLLKCETGIHRLVRVSPFNAQGKRMTSFASVFVCPIVDDTITVELDKAKLTFDYFRCSGAGGQNVNKVNSGVRANYMYTDPETGVEEKIQVENTETRDQPKNKENAIRLLKSILYKKELDRRNKSKKELEDSKADVGWGNQIRSYVFDDCRVKDHRTNYQTTDVQGVMNGNIDGFIKSFLMSKF